MTETAHDRSGGLGHHAGIGIGGIKPRGGGAGFGSALLRDPNMVKEDVLDEYVSVDAAQSRYGVVLTGSLENYDLNVDVVATEALRKQMQAQREGAK